MLNYNIERISFQEKTSWVIPDENWSRLKMEEMNRMSFWLHRKMKLIGSWNQTNAAIRLSYKPWTFKVVADSSDKFLFMWGKNILFWVWIDSWRPVFALSDTVEVQKDSFYVIFILEKEGWFYQLTQFVHFFQGHLLFLLI